MFKILHLPTAVPITKEIKQKKLIATMVTKMKKIS